MLVVDDERPARMRLIRLLQEFADVTIVGEAANGLEALAQVETLRPDVIFLDIEMPGLSGLEVARALPAHGPRVVFATAYDEFAVKAFEANAIDYLLKPVEGPRLAKTIAKLREKTSRLDADVFAHALSKTVTATKGLARIAIRVGAKFVVLDTRKIACLSSCDHYVEIVAEEKKVLADETLDVLEARLNPERFVRVHRSAIINLDFLKEMRREGDRKYTAVLSDYFDTEQPISRDALPKLKTHLGLE